jgi:hypothetical protein
VDGRFGRCRGCGQVHVFCGYCASVGACCRGCAGERRLAAHRRANQTYSRTPGGQASNRDRQARRRGRIADLRRRVTDTISTQDPVPATTPMPSSSEVEPTRDAEISPHESSNPSSKPDPARGTARRCACCSRVLSGRVRPSEWTPARRPGYRRAPRPPGSRVR